MATEDAQRWERGRPALLPRKVRAAHRNPHGRTLLLGRARSMAPRLECSRTKSDPAAYRCPRVLLLLTSPDHSHTRAMLIFERSQWEIDRPSVITVGVFDGLHRGHQALIRRVIERAHAMQALAGVLTFSEHPLSVLAPPFAPKKLLYPDRKRQLLGQAGLDFLVCAAFTKEFARMLPEEFVRHILVKQARVAAVVCGEDFRFGAEGLGTVAFLQRYGRELGFEVDVVPPVVHAGMFVRSTMIRDLLYTGDVVKAAALLTRPHELRGLVVRGQGRGRSLGFPTANLEVSPAYVVPARGVYLCSAFLPAHEQLLPALVNIGFNPTFGSERLSIEAHLLDFDGELVGNDLYLFFLAHLRDEKRFANAEELVAQIAKDRERGLALYARPPISEYVDTVRVLVNQR